MGGSAEASLRHNGRDYPFDSTRTELLRADLTIGNLEAPFTRGGEPFDKKYTFKVPPEWAGGLKNAGFDVLNLANNHILDYGPDGLRETVALLDSLGIASCGAGDNDSTAVEAAILDVDGVKVASLGFSMTFPREFWAGPDRPGTAFATERVLAESIGRVAAEVDLIVVSFHWGAELMATPKEYQIFFARKAIDLGADLVLGHHAHILQGLEIYKNRLIIYGLGNFVFGSYSRHARESIILKSYVDARGLLYAKIIPISVDNYQVAFQPRLLRGEARRQLLSSLRELSAKLNGGRYIIAMDGSIVIPPPVSSSALPSPHNHHRSKSPN